MYKVITKDDGRMGGDSIDKNMYKTDDSKEIARGEFKVFLIFQWNGARVREFSWNFYLIGRREKKWLF